MFACDCVHKIYTQQLLYKKSTTPWPVHPIRSPQKRAAGRGFGVLLVVSYARVPFSRSSQMLCCFCSEICGVHIACVWHQFARSSTRTARRALYIYRLRYMGAKKKCAWRAGSVQRCTHHTHIALTSHTCPAPYTHINTSRGKGSVYYERRNVCAWGAWSSLLLDLRFYCIVALLRDLHGKRNGNQFSAFRSSQTHTHI